MGRLNKEQAEENKKVLSFVQQYKEDCDEIAFQNIVKNLENYLSHLVKKFYYVAGYSSDDIRQEALYALATKAIPDYQVEKGPFLGFAKLCIRRHVITLLKSSNNNRNKPLNGSMSLDATAEDNEDGPVSVGGLISTNKENHVEYLQKIETHKKLRHLLMSRLTGLEMRIFELYLRNLSYVDIVREINKRVRKKTSKVNCKVVDNALCRVRKKAIELEEEIANGGTVPLHIFDESDLGLS